MTHAQDYADAVFADRLATFGETVTYYPAAGGSREITAIVARMGEQIDNGDYHQAEREACEIETDRDSTTGIDSPTLGDGLFLNATDATGERWSYDGEVRGDSQKRVTRWTKWTGRRAGGKPSRI